MEALLITSFYLAKSPDESELPFVKLVSNWYK
jgi:hypothetical protein